MWIILRSLKQNREEMSQKTMDTVSTSKNMFSFWPSVQVDCLPTLFASIFSLTLSLGAIFLQSQGLNFIWPPVCRTLWRPVTRTKAWEPAPLHFFFESWIMPSCILFVWKVQYMIYYEQIHEILCNVYIWIPIWFSTTYGIRTCEYICMLSNSSCISMLLVTLFLLFLSMAGNLMAAGVVQLCLTKGYCLEILFCRRLHIIGIWKGQKSTLAPKMKIEQGGICPKSLLLGIGWTIAMCWRYHTA